MKNKRLRKAREKNSLNQEQLAKLVGFYCKSSVSNWENGYASPTLDTAIRISYILNENVEFLFGENIQEYHTLRSRRFS